MDESGNKFIGIDVCTGRTPLTMAIINDHLKLASLTSGSLDGTIEQINRQGSAYIAITSPSRTNIGLLKSAALRRRLAPSHRKGRHPDMRAAEYEMHLTGLPITRTPSEDIKCSKQMLLGFVLYHRLEQIGCSPYPTADARYQWLEVSPEAAFKILFKGQSMLRARTLEGRLQRQLLLFDLDLSVPDPMFFFEELTRYRLLQGSLPMKDVLSISELHATVAAFTAYLAVNHPRQVNVYGIAQESLIYLPASPEIHLKVRETAPEQFELAMSSDPLFQDGSSE